MKLTLLLVLGTEAVIFGILFLFAAPELSTEFGPLWWLIPAGVIGVTALTMAPFLVLSKGIGAAMRQFSGKPDPAFAGAPIGIGTIRTVSMTGLSINDVQQYEISFDVETVDGATFGAACQQLISPQDLATIAVGTMLPVTYRLDRPGVVHLAAPERADEAQLVMQQIRVRKGLSDPDAMLIAHQGVPSRGVVVSATPTGEIRHGHSGMDVSVLVTRPDGTRFTGHKRSYLLPRQLGGIQVGSQVGVHYLPEDESKMSISLPVNG